VITRPRWDAAIVALVGRLIGRRRLSSDPAECKSPSRLLLVTPHLGPRFLERVLSNKYVITRTRVRREEKERGTVGPASAVLVSLAH
jgi:hypothetical protein